MFACLSDSLNWGDYIFEAAIESILKSRVRARYLGADGLGLGERYFLLLK